MRLLDTLQMIGDNVTLVVRLRQGGDSDAMVSSCKARGGGNSGSPSRNNALSPKQGSIHINDVRDGWGKRSPKSKLKYTQYVLIGTG